MRRYARSLVAFALATSVVAGATGWVSGDAQQALTGPPPGSAQWRADRVLGTGLPDPERAKPAEVARFFACLSAAEQQLLLVAPVHPVLAPDGDAGRRRTGLARGGTAVAGLTTPPETVGWILARIAWLPVFAGLLVLIARYARRFEAPWRSGTRAANARRALAGLLAAGFAVFALGLA
ncbi:hypothetical protein SBADM41S_12302 [Streptomyces badius]